MVKLSAVADEAEELNMDVYVKAADLDGRVFSRTWLVEELIEEGRVYEVFGRWKEGKTLAVMDMTAHCCLQWIWGNRRTEKALVIYVAGEAVEDVEMRLAAWRLHHDITGELAFYIRTKPVYITDKVFAARLAAEIETLKENHHGLPVILVVDTLARNFGPGESENSDAGMGAFANNIIDIVARPTKATCLVVHHSGHSDSERGRGHSSFAAAVDGTIKVAMQDEIITMSSVVMRSTSGGDSLSFRVAVEALPGQDNFGNVVRAPVLEYDADHKPDTKKSTKALGKNQRAIIEMLEILHQEHQREIDTHNLKVPCRVSQSELVGALVKQKDMDKSNCYRAIKTMINDELLIVKTYLTTGDTKYMVLPE